MQNVQDIKEFFQNLPSPFPQVYTNIPIEKDVKKKTVLLVTGFSGSGKDTVLRPIFESEEGHYVVTAINRDRREGESENAQIWMRKKKWFETKERYYKNLVKEYVLVEYDEHYGNFYGLPLSSLQKEGSGIPIIRTDIHGVCTLQEELPKYGYQVISVAIMPDNWDQVYGSIMKRSNVSSVDAKRRLDEDIESSSLFLKHINFFLHNSREEINGNPGLELSVEGMRYLVKMYS